jgi:hypothetical protein
MESGKVGAYRLIVIVCIFSASIFFLNNNKKKFTINTHIDLMDCKTNSIAKLSLEHAYEQMNSLFVSRDTDLIVKVVSQFKDHCMYELVEKIIQEKPSFLSYEEKMNILFGLIAHCGAKKNMQYDFLDFLLKYPALYSETPALLSLARSKYPDMIAVFINWGKDRQKNEGQAGLLTRYVEQAFSAAIEENDYAAVEMMLSKKVRIAQNKASEFLWYIVENNKNSSLIPLLVRHAQADVNYAGNGKTLLIEAVEKNNVEMIRVLLDAGAVVDRIVDGKKGSALHIAMKNKYASVEQLLREYGAA